MKHLKIYELFNNKLEETKYPKIGDYIVADCDYDTNGDLEELIAFLNNNIGQIVDICPRERKPSAFSNWGSDDGIFNVEYEDVIPGSYADKRKTWWLRKEEIKYFSDSKEELELKLQIKKFNI